MMMRVNAAVFAILMGFLAGAAQAGEPTAADLAKIQTVVVLYAENRSFDALYGNFPDANGLTPDVLAKLPPQRDRDGSILKELPPIWDGLTAAGVQPAIDVAHTKGLLPNAPFAIDGPPFHLPLSIETRDLWHKFYQNQMQIDGGKNDRFVAWADSGALVMGHYDGSKLPLWDVAKHYTLADNFFMGAFGGSFINHFFLICSCAPIYPQADKDKKVKDLISAVEEDGFTLKRAANSPISAMDGPPVFESDGQLTPKIMVGSIPTFFAVNTMRPPYQPSENRPAWLDKAAADPSLSPTLPPQGMTTIGDLLSDRGITWAWYAGGWQIALDGKNTRLDPNFQTHHQPFNYFADMAPGTAARAEHLLDGGDKGAKFIAAIDAGSLPQVAFYKPQGNLNEHPGYADVLSGDKHLVDIVGHLEKSPQWAHMLVIITYDENGGFWDHVAPPKADRFGPGTRVPALIISPFAKRGYVDHTLYDTTSILRFLTRRFALPTLAGIAVRDKAMQEAGSGQLGDLTGALDFGGK
jgi:acid phosphatase